MVHEIRDFLKSPKRPCGMLKSRNCLDDTCRPRATLQGPTYSAGLLYMYLEYLKRKRCGWKSQIRVYSLTVANFSRSLRDFLTVPSWAKTSAGTVPTNFESFNRRLIFLSASETPRFDLCSTMQSETFVMSVLGGYPLKKFLMTKNGNSSLGRSLYRAKAQASYIRKENGADEVTLYLNSLWPNF